MVDLTSMPLWGRLGSSSNPRTARGLPLLLVGQGRVADRGGPRTSPAAYPGSTTTLCTLHFAVPPLVAVRADRFRMLESAAQTRHI